MTDDVAGVLLLRPGDAETAVAPARLVDGRSLSAETK
jgi:hypothetical protein